MKRICVIGSLNTDLVAVIDRFPKPGETITGREFGVYPGGKGANQAVAAGRLGANVRMIGKLGDDLYGRQYMENLRNNNVDTCGIGIESAASSGIALIEVESSGENRIIIISGANGMVDCGFIDSKLELILECDIILLQLEIPVETVIYAVKLLKNHGKTVILDPAPAAKLPDDIYPGIDYITPNETELEAHTGIKIENDADIRAAAAILLAKGVGTVIAKVGKRGAFIIGKNEFLYSPAFDVKVVDTTAAGDSFNAGFAFALAEGRNLAECATFANATASLSTTAKGAQGAMPDLARVNSLIADCR